MALFHISTTLYYTGCNLSELQSYLAEMIEECEGDDMKKDIILTLNVSLWRSVLALQGKTVADASKALDDPEFEEEGFLENVRTKSVNPSSPFNWHWSLKIVVLVHFDHHHEAAELGFQIIETSINHPEHRHVGIAIFYHSIALIACIRDATLEKKTLEKYRTQVERNRETLEEWASHSEINYRMYHKLVVSCQLLFKEESKKKLISSRTRNYRHLLIRRQHLNCTMMQLNLELKAIGIHFSRSHTSSLQSTIFAMA